MTNVRRATTPITTGSTRTTVINNNNIHSRPKTTKRDNKKESHIFWMWHIMKSRTILLCLIGLFLAIVTFRNLVQVPSVGGGNGGDNNNSKNIQTFLNQTISTTKIENILGEITSQSSPSSSSPAILSFKNTTTTTTTIFYSSARSDRSGSVIQDMLMSHAFCYKYNLSYGGACTSNWNLPQFQGKRILHLNLLQSIGFDTILPLLESCPSNIITNSLNNDEETMESILSRLHSPPTTNNNNNEQEMKKEMKNHLPIRRMLSRNWYIANDTLIFTPDYLNHIHHLVRYDKDPSSSASSNPKEQQQQHSQPYTIAVHIRRGDIGPCRARTRGYPRYLPNTHFLRLIDLYSNSSSSNNSQRGDNMNDDKSILPPFRVVIYSESESFESFDIFRQRGYDVILDGNIGDVWKGLLSANVLILSRSSFSLVPAILTKGKVVYTPFWHEPLPHWDIVPNDILNQTLYDFKQLKQKHCPKRKKQQLQQ